MKQIFIRDIFGPVTRRMGTALAAFMAGTLAVDPSLADQLAVAFGGVLLVAVDLVFSHFDRKNTEAA